MRPVRQEDGLGCAVACVAFVLNITYIKALALFHDGKRRVKKEANFYCPEIMEILNNTGLSYSWEKLLDSDSVLIKNDLSIVFIKKSKKHLYGHFLVKHKDKWMDPWINLPNNNIKAGFRNVLPGEPTYVVYKV